MKKIVQSENEITVKTNCSFEEICKLLQNKNFDKINEYRLKDVFFIPAKLKTKNLTVREIIKESVYVRNYWDKSKKNKSCSLTKKIKNIDSKGNILNQSQINCKISDEDSGKKFLKSMGYKQLMVVNELGRNYQKNNLVINVKNVIGGDCLIEIEENEHYQSIDTLKQQLFDINIPVDTSNFFVKKAEEQLSKKLGR